mmetsp:Transcript_6512/g.22467  ORF Transcript_6512/g.22467 Transcript_6512/m.22467 type:complete len:221 (+) Transcript_6512:1480-2142(+)
MPPRVDPVLIDRQISEEFNRFATRVVGATGACLTAIRQEYCWTSFELCTAFPTEEKQQDGGVQFGPGGAMMPSGGPPTTRQYEGCDHTHPRGDGAVQEVAVCKSEDHAVVCGPSPWGKLCMKVPGDTCATIEPMANQVRGNPAVACGHSPEEYMGLATRCSVSAIRNGPPRFVVPKGTGGQDLSENPDHIHAGSPRTLEIFVRGSARKLAGPVWEIPLPN